MFEFLLTSISISFDSLSSEKKSADSVYFIILKTCSSNLEIKSGIDSFSRSS